MDYLDEVLSKLGKEANISKEELAKKVSRKQNEFSGLISEDGAAHLVANDLGINLLKENNRRLEIKNIAIGMKNVNVVGRVFKTSGIVEFKRSDNTNGKVVNVFVGDSSGYLKLALWDTQTALVEEGKIKIGDIIQIKNGIVKENLYGGVEISIGKYGNISVVNDSVELPSAESLNKKLLSNPTEKASIRNLVPGTFEIFGSVVDVLKTNFIFNVCPICGKVVERTGNGGKCAEHGEVDSAPAMVVNAMIDDETGNLRAVFFRETAEKFCGISARELSKFGGDKRFNEIAQKIVGRLISIRGNVKKNKMFDRMEMIVNEFKDLNTLDESKRLIDAIEIKIGE